MLPPLSGSEKASESLRLIGSGQYGRIGSFGGFFPIYSAPDSRPRQHGRKEKEYGPPRLSRDTGKLLAKTSVWRGSLARQGARLEE
jgi:hypothetical protein